MFRSYRPPRTSTSKAPRRDELMIRSVMNDIESLVWYSPSSWFPFLGYELILFSNQPCPTLSSPHWVGRLWKTNRKLSPFNRVMGLWSEFQVWWIHSSSGIFCLSGRTTRRLSWQKSAASMSPVYLVDVAHRLRRIPRKRNHVALPTAAWIVKNFIANIVFLK